MKLVRYAWWPLVLVTSIAAWWGVAYWLEPRPLWVIPEGETLEFMQYDAAQERLLGMRPLADSQQQFVILDAKTGKALKDLTVPIGSYISGRYDFIPQQPRLIESSVWWLHQIIHSDDTVTIELKEWKWATDTTANTRHQWKVGLELDSDVNSIRYMPLRFCWSPNTSKLLLVYYVLPTSRIMQKMKQAFNPCSLFDIWQWMHDYNNTLMHCNVWQWQSSNALFEKTNCYNLRAAEMTDGRSEMWSHDDLRFVRQRVKDQTHYSFLEFDTLTGNLLSSVVDASSQHRSYLQSYRVSELLMLRTYHAAEKRENGRVVYHTQQGPQRDGNLIWKLDEWRPIFNVNTWKPVPWPSSLNAGIVANDQLQVDALDTTRYMFSTIDQEGNPLRKQTKDRHPQLECIFLRYSNGVLTVEHQMTVRNSMNCSHGVLCGQLFVQGSQDFEDSERLISLIRNVPWLYQWYWEKWVKLNGSYVAEIDTNTGNKRWKKSERCISGHLPLLGKDRLLLRLQRLNSPNPTGYECYALPMKIYSPWWPPGVAALILLVAICHSLRQRKSPILPTGSPT